MPRTPRVDFPGAYHHVFARGIEKREIFRDDCDREEFRRRMLTNLERFTATCIAWSFLPNHFHLLFQSDGGTLSRFMHCLMSGYSLYFNRRHVRVGHLFQNRFRSVVIDSEPYLLELVRYIHLNPLRAKVVGTLEELADYRWSGHRNIVRFKQFPWRGVPYLCKFFRGDGRQDPVTNYRTFLEEKPASDAGVAISDRSGADDDAVIRAWGRRSIATGQENRYRHFLCTVSRVCRERGISADRIRDGRRDRATADARREILRVCIHEMGMDRRVAASWMGITTVGAAYLLRGAASRLEADEI